jgi:NDP-sugar pyrophosphorylase family protein
LLEQLQSAGVRHTVLLTGHAAERIRQVLGDDFSGMKLTYSTETRPLGTAGALRQASPHLESDTLLLMNGDSYCDVTIPDLVAAHHGHGADLTMTLAYVPDASRFGLVQTTEDGRVIDFREKQDDAGGGWINAGIYVFEKALVKEVPPGQFVSLERDLLPVWVHSKKLYGYPVEAGFIDIGTPASYASAEGFFHAEA